MISLITYGKGQAYAFYLKAWHTIAQDYLVLALAIGRLCCFCALLLEASQLLLFLSWLLSTQSHPSIFIWPTSLYSCQYVHFRWDINSYAPRKRRSVTTFFCSSNINCHVSYAQQMELWIQLTEKKVTNKVLRGKTEIARNGGAKNSPIIPFFHEKIWYALCWLIK